jgi:hypothetical protein
MTTKPRGLDDLLVAFEQAAIARERALNDADHKKANKSFKTAAALLKKIDAYGGSGSEAVRKLLSHAEPGVRFLAATHLLEREPEICVPVLEQLMTRGDSSAVSAMMALKFWRGEYKL